MENILLDTLLFDYYNALLTARQSEVYELYYLQNLSLSEIAREYKITPQAVRDILARTRKNLLKYEDALGVVRKHGQLNELKERLGAVEETHRENMNTDVAKKLREAVEILEAVMDE